MIKSSNDKKKRKQRNFFFDIFLSFRWICSYLALVDKDKSKTLNRNECRTFVNDLLNVELDETRLDEYFSVKIKSKIFLFDFIFVQIADKNGENQLDPDEFVTFYRQVTRRDDLYEIMQKFDERKNFPKEKNLFL